MTDARLARTSEEDVEVMLIDALMRFEGDEDCPPISEIESFQQAGVLTRNRGIVARLQDGSEFQVTIVRSR